MSGICGILRLDGAPPTGIDAMIRRLVNRGPDGQRTFQEGSLALGHAALHATPEALHEPQPFIHQATGAVITADLRLDNREELIAVLGLADGARVIGDGEIVLEAYLKWGEDCPLHLLGDFAFAIWDPRKQTLFCARDQMGMKQLIYSHVEGKMFAFASEPQAVLLADGIPRKINDARIADFFEGYLEDIDLTSTFFEDVLRLPPAHRLTVSRARFRISRYWSLEPPEYLRLASDREYEEAFRTHFDHAVKRRMRAPDHALGSMLSGGIDSGSVTAVAAQIRKQANLSPLPTFSAVGPDPANCVETSTIRQAQSCLPITPHSVDWSDLGPLLPQLQEDLYNVSDPFDANFNIARAIYRTAAQKECRVLLDGAAGDITLGVPMHLHYLLLSGRWVRLAHEINGEATFYGNGWTQRRILRNMAPEVIPLTVRFALRNIRNRLLRGTARSRIPEELYHQIDMRERQEIRDRANRIFTGSHRHDRAKALTSPTLVVGRERYDRTASSYGVEPRDPFLDLDFVHFALSLPAEQLRHGGVRKLIMRRAMANLLPRSIRFRKGKEHLGQSFTNALWALPHQDQSPLACIPARWRPAFEPEDAKNHGHWVTQNIEKGIFNAAVFRWAT